MCILYMYFVGFLITVFFMNGCRNDAEVDSRADLVQALTGGSSKTWKVGSYIYAHFGFPTTQTVLYRLSGGEQALKI